MGQIGTKLSNENHSRQNKRSELQEAIKKIDQRIEEHEDAKAEFSKDLPTFKENLAAIVEKITEKQVKKIN